MGRLDDVFTEIAAVQRWQERAADADNTASLFTRDQVDQMALALRMYPDLRAGQLLALGQGNYAADHPLVQEVGTLAAALNMRDHPYGRPYGSSSSTAGFRRALAAEQNRYVNQQLRQKPVKPRGIEGNDRAEALWNDLTSRGLVRDGFVDLDSRDRASNAIITNLAASGVDVPVLRDGMPYIARAEAPEATEAEGSSVRALQEQGMPNRRLRLDRFDGIDYPTAEPAAGPGALDVVREVTGSQPTTPQEVQVAGLVDRSIEEPFQGAFQALDAPVQELQGQVRNVYAATHGREVDWFEPQSDALIRLTTGLDSGSGFFADPESDLAAERRRREAERGQIGGHNVTLGRWVADGLTPFDPDTKPYMVLSGLVDLGVQVADPSAAALRVGGRARAGAQLFEAADGAGGIRGLRWVVRPQNVQHWLDGKVGQATLAELAARTSPTDIWRGMNHKIPMDLAAELADATDPADVRAILEPQLGTSIREVSTATMGAGRSAADPRRIMPMRGRIDAHDKDIVAFELESWLHNTGMDEAGAALVIDEVARAKNPVEINAAIRGAMRDADGALARAGIADDELRATLTNLHRDTHESIWTSTRASLSSQGPSSTPVMIGGEAVDGPSAALINELAPRYLALPDARDIRRVTSQYSNIFTKGSPFATTTAKPRMATSVLEHFQNDLWKPFQLMRAAWTVRVVGEEQLRMAAAGYDSMFNHPLSYISWRVGRKGAKDVEGDLLSEAEQFASAMAQTHGSWIDRGVMSIGRRTTYTKGNLAERDRYLPSVGSELLRLHGDPVASHLANADSFEDAFEWFTRGGGNAFRGGLASAYPGEFDTLDQARAYLTNVQNRIHHATGGDADLLEAVKTGKLDGDPLLAGTTLNSKIVPRLKDRVDVLPEEIIGEEVHSLPSGARSQVSASWDRAVDGLFGVLMTNRTNNLSRAPTFKQEYWREMERVLPALSPDARAQVIAQARAANLGRRPIQRMERVTQTGALTLDEADLLAKGHALDQVKDLLYDLSRKGRFMDAARLVFPFGEAWREVLSRWGTLVRENPATIRRVQQVIQGARGEDFGEVMGAPEDKGFFFKNEFGEEVFVYPGSGLLTDALLGVEVPLTGRVAGLSMFGTVMPGLGPAVQIPVGWFLESKPGPQAFKTTLNELLGVDVGPFGTVEEQFLPFGSIGEQDKADILSVDSYMPVWMRTGIDAAFNGELNDASYNNAVMSMAAYLQTTGQYGTTRAETQRLMDDARSKARTFYVIKALAQTAAPASPSPDWRVVDNNGQSLRVRALVEEYRAMQQEDYASADQRFFEAYGDDVLAAVQPHTAGVEYSLPTTREGVQWLLEHPEVDEKLPHTYGFFAPKGGEYDYSLFQEQLEEGDRDQLTLDEWVRLMNTTKGDIRYQDYITQVGEHRDTDEGRAYLRDAREFLSEEYDGWGDRAGVPGRPGTEVLIRELYDALSVDAVRETEAGQGLAYYLEGRDSVVAYSEEIGEGLGSQAMAEGREWLAGVAADAIEKFPAFRDIYEIVLSREVEVDG